MNRRILIVEDDPAIRMLVRTALETEGHEVAEAADGLEVLPAARASRPDLILLDIGLPGIHGFAVLAQLKRDDELSDVPVMMITAWASPELLAKARALGADDYVQKPFDVSDLRARVARALGAEVEGYLEPPFSALLGEPAPVLEPVAQPEPAQPLVADAA